MSREEIKKGLFSYALFTTDAAGQKIPTPGYDPNRKYLSVVIIGCVDYGFVSDPSRHHQTGFASEVRKVKGGVAPAPLISPDEKLIGIEDLRLHASPFGVGRYAD